VEYSFVMKAIASVPELIKKLGGASKLAKWAGYEDARGVCNWTTRGIPPSYHLRLTLLARQRGLVIDPDVFGLQDHEADILRSVLSDPGAPRPRPKRRPIQNIAA
jgi:hypothetical protein